MDHLFDRRLPITRRGKYGIQRIVLAALVVTIGWLATARASPEIPDVAMMPPSPPTDQELAGDSLHQFVAHHATVHHFNTGVTRNLAHWLGGKDSICPLTLGLDPGQNAFVTARLRALAAYVGAPVHEPTLKNFLNLRAQALLDDDYYASDVAFVGLKGPIDVVLGPYEADDDAWFGAKTAYEASIALVNEPATQHVSKITTHLQELEDHLPLTSNLRGRKLGAAAPIVVLDAIYHGGRTGAGNAAAGYGLPNDLRVQNAVGARTGTYSNILKLRYDSTFRPIADAVLMDADRSTLRFEDIRDEIMFIRLFDSLGPQLVTGTKQPIAETLRENATVAKQIRSMLLSLWGHRYLIAHGYLDRRESTADAAVSRAAMEFISLMAKGDATGVRSLLQHYAVVTPTIRNVLARLGPAPALQRPIYHTADGLSPTDR
jgi:hypothetical protein